MKQHHIMIDAVALALAKTRREIQTEMAAELEAIRAELADMRAQAGRLLKRLETLEGSRHGRKVLDARGLFGRRVA